jgi:TonB family protein
MTTAYRNRPIGLERSATMFTTNLLLLLPVIGVAAGLVAAMLVIREQDARLAPAGFGTKTAPVLIPHYTKEGALVAMALPLALVLLGSAGLMLAQYLRPAAPAPPKRIIHVILSDFGPGESITGKKDLRPVEPAVGKTPTVGVPKPVPPDQAGAEGGDTQDDMARAAARSGDLDKLNRDSVEIVAGNGEIPGKGYVALDKYPELVKRVDPVYPSIAVSTGSQGRVCLQALLDIDGRVLQVEVSQSSGNPALDDAAADAVRQWVFTPAIAPDGKPARVWQSCPIRFRLGN